MSETKNIVIQQNNGTDYDILKPERSINDKLFGYWWKKVSFSPQLTTRSSNIVYSTSQQSYSFTISFSYSDKLYFSASGSLTTSGMTSQSITMTVNREIRTTSTTISFNVTPSNYVGNYIYCNRSFFCRTTDQAGQNIIPIYLTGSAYWTEDGAYGTNHGQWFLTSEFTYNPSYWWTISGKVDTTEYVYSSDRSKYPNGGIEDNCGYTFLGIPFSNALFLSKSDVQV